MKGKENCQLILTGTSNRAIRILLSAQTSTMSFTQLKGFKEDYKYPDFS